MASGSNFSRNISENLQAITSFYKQVKLMQPTAVNPVDSLIDNLEQEVAATINTASTSATPNDFTTAAAKIQQYIEDQAEGLKKNKVEQAREYLEQAYSLIEALLPFGQSPLTGVLNFIKQAITGLDSNKLKYFEILQQQMPHTEHDETKLVTQYYEDKSSAEQNFIEFKLKSLLTSTIKPVLTNGKKSNELFISHQSQEHDGIQEYRLNEKYVKIAFVRNSILSCLIDTYTNIDIRLVFGEVLRNISARMATTAGWEDQPLKDLVLDKVDQLSEAEIAVLKVIQQFYAKCNNDKSFKSVKNNVENTKNPLVWMKTAYKQFIKCGGQLHDLDLAKLHNYLHLNNDEKTIDFYISKEDPGCHLEDFYRFTDTGDCYAIIPNDKNNDEIKIVANNDNRINAAFFIAANHLPVAVIEEEFKASHSTIVSLREEMSNYLKNVKSISNITDDSKGLPILTRTTVVGDIRDYIQAKLNDSTYNDPKHTIWSSTNRANFGLECVILDKFFSDCETRDEVFRKLEQDFQEDSEFIKNNYEALIDFFTADGRDTPYNWAHFFAQHKLQADLSKHVELKDNHYHIIGKPTKFIPGDGNCFYHTLQYLIEQSIPLVKPVSPYTSPISASGQPAAEKDSAEKKIEAQNDNAGIDSPTAEKLGHSSATEPSVMDTARSSSDEANSAKLAQIDVEETHTSSPSTDSTNQLISQASASTASPFKVEPMEERTEA